MTFKEIVDEWTRLNCPKGKVSVVTIRHENSACPVPDGANFSACICNGGVGPRPGDVRDVILTGIE